MRISDWSSDVCSSDLTGPTGRFRESYRLAKFREGLTSISFQFCDNLPVELIHPFILFLLHRSVKIGLGFRPRGDEGGKGPGRIGRSERARKGAEINIVSLGVVNLRYKIAVGDRKSTRLNSSH